MTINSQQEKRYIGEKFFTHEEQQLFALISSDYNPMHIDAIAARRLIAGHQVVHGIHTLLTAIEYWQNDKGLHPASISCSFNNPVRVGNVAIFTQHQPESNVVVIEATVNGLPCTQITISASQGNTDSRIDQDSAEFASGKESYFPDKLTTPLDKAPEFHLDKKYIIKLKGADYAAKFPQSYRYFGKEGFAAITALSYFVGMICPGLHSMFSSLSFKVNQNPPKDGILAFEVQKYNDRYRLFNISFRGCIYGSIKAFLRPPPYEQPSMKVLSQYIEEGEFRGTNSLVIGGSRGLGELTAKILASGGGDVIITYASGLDDAQKICNEINASGRGTCKVLKIDLTTDSFNSINIDRNALDVVYFFATPRIARSKVNFFDPLLFHEFSEFYINKFYQLCVYLEVGEAVKKINVFFPSTVYVAERPEGMTEYSMAKSAAEVLIEEINKSFTKVSVLSARLPRLNTDQTSSIIKLSTESNAGTLIPIIRSLNKTK